MRALRHRRFVVAASLAALLAVPAGAADTVEVKFKVAGKQVLGADRTSQTPPAECYNFTVRLSDRDAKRAAASKPRGKSAKSPAVVAPARVVCRTVATPASNKLVAALYDRLPVEMEARLYRPRAGGAQDNYFSVFGKGGRVVSTQTVHADAANDASPLLQEVTLEFGALRMLWTSGGAAPFLAQP
ncbi:MAG TPA: hypothetical protein VLU43_07885 [Anaeromyxobacteraceae bacterium]|nr:hypothetical protein [Anaeromyxobacteraceae bacterium]